MKAIVNPWMSFKGVKNTDIGVAMISMPVRQIPAKQGDKTVIDGKDGFMFVSKESYGAITISQDLAVLNPENINAVDNWLNGHGELIYFDDPTKAYDAYMITSYKKQNISKRLDGISMSVQFTCQPFKHEVNAEQIEMTNSGNFLGRGNVNAKPRITVYGSGSCNLAVNGDTFYLELTSGVPITIDCDAKVVYSVDDDGVMYFNGNCVSIDEKCDWYELNPNGENNRVSFTNGITKVKIDPEWRWL